MLEASDLRDANDDVAHHPGHDRVGVVLELALQHQVLHLDQRLREEQRRPADLDQRQAFSLSFVAK